MHGEMAEWSNAAVLKTVEGHTSGGSNPSFSAKKTGTATFRFFYAQTRAKLDLAKGKGIKNQGSLQSKLLVFFARLPHREHERNAVERVIPVGIDALYNPPRLRQSLNHPSLTREGCRFVFIIPVFFAPQPASWPLH